MQQYAFDTDKLMDICRANAVTSVGVFGSMARGEATRQSDIDLLVEFGDRKSLLDLVRLERELSAALGRKVDLLTKDAISPYLRDRILGEVQTISMKRDGR
jgi:predicted nucleotidyltransferase